MKLPKPIFGMTFSHESYSCNIFFGNRVLPHQSMLGVFSSVKKVIDSKYTLGGVKDFPFSFI